MSTYQDMENPAKEVFATVDTTVETKRRWSPRKTGIVAVWGLACVAMIAWGATHHHPPAAATSEIDSFVAASMTMPVAHVTSARKGSFKGAGHQFNSVKGFTPPSQPKAAQRGSLVISNSVTKKPDLTDPVLRAKLAKGMGHNYYGEPAWPNDLLYIFPVVILGTIALVVGLATMEPTALGEPADPFATPLEILPEWYFFPTFNALRVIPNKLLGVLSMAAVPVGLLTVPFLESINKFQNPFRRPIATSVFLIGTFYAIWMGIGATMPIDKAISLGVF